METARVVISAVIVIIGAIMVILGCLGVIYNARSSVKCIGSGYEGFQFFLLALGGAITLAIGIGIYLSKNLS